jgi:hypothetical protein
MNKINLWHLIWENELIEFFNYIGVDTTFIYKNAPYLFDRKIIRNEVISNSLNLSIEWKTDRKYGEIEKGGSVTEIFISNYIGFTFTHKDWLKINRFMRDDGIRGTTIKIDYSINDLVESKIVDSEVLNIGEIEDFLIKFSPESFLKIIRDRRINEIINESQR